jgi:tetratricopeptide (TPR) repeat protein
MALRLEDPETTLRVLIVQAQARSEVEYAAAIFEIFFSTADQVEAHSKSGLEAMVAAGHDIYGDRLREAGRIEEAEAQYRQSLDVWQRMGNVDGIAYPIGNLGRLALQAGRIQEAYECFSESVAIARAIGNGVGIVDWLPQLGNALLTMGDVTQAEACYDEVLALCEEMGNQVAAADALAYLGYTVLVKGEREGAGHPAPQLNRLSHIWRDAAPIGCGLDGAVSARISVVFEGDGAAGCDGRTIRTRTSVVQRGGGAAIRAWSGSRPGDASAGG